MSCLGPYYNPIPTRDWYRVQNKCSFNIPESTNSNGETFIPQLGYSIPNYQVGHFIQMLNKGNVLQYKKNSAQLTKSQTYSLIAKNQWTNRSKNYASQSQNTTNPNIQSLKRVGGINITLNGVPTTDPVTKPKPPPQPNYVALPTQQNASLTNPIIPTPPSGLPATNAIPVVATPAPPAPIVIEDGGIFLCNIVVNPITGEDYVQPSIPNYHPTSDSNVGGHISYLYWKEGMPTWFPKQRYIMNTSGNKWPVNSKAIFPANGFIPPIPTPTPTPTPM